MRLGELIAIELELEEIRSDMNAKLNDLFIMIRKFKENERDKDYE
jgi:hypothetical protein